MAEKKAEKKAEEKKTAAPDVPDELPSLAEDILTAEPAAEGKDAAPAGSDVPDELPALDEELPLEPEQPAPGARPAQPMKAPSASAKPAGGGLSEEEEGAMALDDESYFGHLVGHLKKRPSIPGDFLDEMKTFWKGHGGEREAEMREDLKTSFELDLEKEMQEKVKQLKDLEALWKSQKMEFERTKKLVENTEIEISLRSEELKKILDTLTELREVYKDIRIKMKVRQDRQRAVPRTPAHQPQRAHAPQRRPLPRPKPGPLARRPALKALPARLARRPAPSIRRQSAARPARHAKRTAARRSQRKAPIAGKRRR